MLLKPKSKRHAKQKQAPPPPPPPHPPPNRRTPRRLSLRTAIAAASRREGAEVKSLHRGIDNGTPSTKTKSGKQQEREAHLLELQAEIIVREDHVSQREKRLEARELEINEREALLEAHMKLAESKEHAEEPSAGTQADRNKEAQALKVLREELRSQEISLKEAQGMLREREDFVEQCENELVEKTMLLAEREARVEQSEADA